MKIKNITLAPPRIEMMPLIDIVFLLLVFFIFAMLSMAVHRGQDVDLPQSSNTKADTEKALSITIQGGGSKVHIFVDEEPVNLEHLTARFNKKRSAKHSGRDYNVQIFADKNVEYQELFNVLDRIKLAGLTRISLMAQPEKKGQ